MTFEQIPLSPISKAMTIGGSLNGIWYDQICVGGIGGNTFDFYCCRFGNHGPYILVHGHQGAYCLWHHIEVVIDHLVFYFLCTDTSHILEGTMKSSCRV
jgi:hypothetical protein